MEMTTTEHEPATPADLAWQAAWAVADRAEAETAGIARRLRGEPDMDLIQAKALNDLRTILDMKSRLARVIASEIDDELTTQCRQRLRGHTEGESA